MVSLEQHLRNNESKNRYRQEHYAMVIEKEREKNKRYREANRELIREKARAKYVEVRRLAGKPVTKEYKPQSSKKSETPGPDAPIESPRKFGTLDKICQVSR